MTTDSKASDVEAREREAFEQWAIKEGMEIECFALDLGDWRKGDYISHDTEYALKAWLARASQQPSAQELPYEAIACAAYHLVGVRNDLEKIKHLDNDVFARQIATFEAHVKALRALLPRSPETAPNGEREWYPNHEADGHETGE